MRSKEVLPLLVLAMWLGVAAGCQTATSPLLAPEPAAQMGVDSPNVDESQNTVSTSSGGEPQQSGDPGEVAMAPQDGGQGQAGSEEETAFVVTRLLVKFRPDVQDAEQNLVVAMDARVVDEIPGIGVKVIELGGAPSGLTLPASELATARLREIQQRPEVEFAELDLLHDPNVAPNDPWYFGQWHLPMIGATQAWSISTGSANLTIAILDSGIDATHPDLASKLVPGWNCYDGNSDTSDVVGHGTAVAGVAAAIGNNSVGVASLAWACRIMPIRVTNSYGITSDSVLARGLTWAADHGARVANLSVATSNLSLTLSSAAQYFQSKGGVITLAAGNSSTYLTDADNPYILTISATDTSDAVATFSNTGSCVDLAAPGVSIYTTARGGGYATGSGTSFASPIAAGVAALVLSTNPGLSGQQVQSILTGTAKDLGPVGWDAGYGFGRVDAAAAVQKAATLTTTPSDATPPKVYFTSPASGATVSGIVLVQATALDNVGVTSVKFSVDDALRATDSVGPYTFAWDASGATVGTHILKASASDAAGNSSTAQVVVNVTRTGDAVSPVVSITSPTDGQRVKTGVLITVSASDNVGVAMVELYVDGALNNASTIPPFSLRWNGRTASTQMPHKFQCKAYDAAGNMGLSQIVTVYKR